MPTGERPSIIIPVHRASEDVRECLASLRTSGDIAAAHVVVIDDFSDDGTAEMVEQDFPDVTLVRRPTNGGFASAVNTGMARVPAASRFVALLNSDTTVEAGWLASAIEAMEGDESVGVVAPRIVLHEDPNTIDSAGQGYTIAGWAYRRGHGSRFGPPFDRPERVFGATGCAAVFRRSALGDQPMVFRDDFVCYYEDTDLAFRLQRAGWGCLYVPDSVVRHKVSRSYDARPAARAYHVSRNLEVVFWEQVPGRLLWRAACVHLLFTLLHATRTTLQRHPLAYALGKLAFLRSAPEAWRHRRQRQAGHDVDQWIERRWLAAVMKRRSRQDATMCP